MNRTLTEDTHENSNEVINLVRNGQNLSDERLHGDQEHLEDHFLSDCDTDKSQVTCEFCVVNPCWCQMLMQDIIIPTEEHMSKLACSTPMEVRRMAYLQYMKATFRLTLRSYNAPKCVEDNL